MKPGPDVDMEFEPHRGAFGGKREKRIGFAETGTEHNARQYGLYGTRKDRTEICVMYEGERVRTAVSGLAPSSKRPLWEQPSLIWMKAGLFSVVKIFDEED